MSKTNAGLFFEDYEIGQVFRHGPLRNVEEGERALYQALYPTRFAVAVSDPVAMVLGLEGAPLDDLIVFHRSANKMVVHPVERIQGRIRGTGDVISVNRPPIVNVEEFYTGRLIFQD